MPGCQPKALSDVTQKQKKCDLRSGVLSSQELTLQVEPRCWIWQTRAQNSYYENDVQKLKRKMSSRAEEKYTKNKLKTGKWTSKELRWF